MRALVTGADGFVGRHLVAALAARGQPARAAVRAAGTRVAGAHESVTVGDMTRQPDWSAALAGVDTVFHLAARVHRSGDDAAAQRAFAATNVDATLRLARAAADAGVLRFVFVSSAKVMGERSGARPFVESDAPQPPDAYARSKWQAEQQLAEAAGRVELTIVRPPLVYGPGVGANFLRLLRAATSAWPLPLGSATAERSMAYVGNLVDALVLCAAHPQAAGRTYFVADAEDLSVAALLGKLRRRLGRPGRLWRAPVPVLAALLALAGRRAEADRLFSPFRLDTRRIRDELGWSPPHCVDDALAATLQWYLESHDR
jgi:UDP-glucose 4-epimerase